MRPGSVAEGISVTKSLSTMLPSGPLVSLVWASPLQQRTHRDQGPCVFTHLTSTLPA